MTQRVALVGFMGAGKTTVARFLAYTLKWEFVDMDQAITAREGRSISCIFSESGEAFFRELETTVLSELAQQPQVVVATGGGVVLAPTNRTLLHQHFAAFHLSVTTAGVLSRLAGDRSRPLLEGPDREDRIREMLAKRMPLYQEFKTVNTEGRTVSAIVEELLKTLS